MTTVASRLARMAAVSVALLLACSRTGAPEREAPAPVPSLTTFEVEVDAATGTLDIRPLAAGSGGLAALTEVPVVQDGHPGTGPADTVELVTEGTATVPGGCGAVASFDAQIRLRSFYAGYQLRNAYVELLSMTPSGREACNSVPAVEGLSDQYGLFSYGDLTEAATSGDSAVRTWSFRLPDTTRFVFRGRVMGELVDVMPPATEAAPAGGIFDAPQTVALSCHDLGSGCAVTYYTTDGTEPSASSTVYTAPIPILATTTLRFFSVDAAGNAEVPRSETYVIDDGMAPTVVSVDPYDGQGDVATSKVVTVEFSELMDPATVPAALGLTGPGGPVDGTVASGAGNTWTFSPTAPLELATRYTIQVSAAAQDLTGHPLAAAHSSWFVTTTPSLVISGTGSATYGKPSIAQDAAGNELALFSAATQSGVEILWSYYDAAGGTWTAERPILTYWSPLQPMFTVDSWVVSNGTTFLAAWQNPSDGALETAIFTGGQPGPVKKHWKLKYTNDPRLALASNGIGYAMVGASDTSGHVNSAVFNGSYWGFITSTVDGLSGTSDAPSVAPYGTSSYIAAFRYGGTAIYTSRYDASSWSWKSTLLPGASGTASMLPPAIAASGTRACVAWGTTTGPVQASLSLDSSAFSAAANLTQGYGEPARFLAAAANGQRFAIVWNGYGSVYQYGAGSGRWYWTGPNELAERTGNLNSAVVAPAGDGFVTALSISDDLLRTKPAHVWVNRDDPSWGFTWASATLAEPWAADAADPTLWGRSGAPALLSWARDDGAAMRVETVSYGGSALGAEAQVSLPGVGGSAAHVRLARNTGGDVLAVWHQDHRGDLAVFAALRRAGTWDPPVLLATGARDPEVASNGAGFMVVYRLLTDLYEYSLTAAELSAGAWGAPTILQVDGSYPVIASDGTTYAVAWEYGGYVNAALRGTTGWSALTNVSGGSAYGTRPAIAARPGEYLFAYRLDISSSHVVSTRKATVTGGSSWSWGSTSSLASGLTTSSGPVLAAGGSGYVAVWADSSAARAAILSGGSWGQSTTIVPQGGCTMATAAATTAGWLAAFNCTGLRLATYSGGAWSATAQPGLAPTELAAAGDGTGYKVLARVDTGATSAIEQLDVTGRTIHASTVLSADTADSTSTSICNMAVIHDGVNWVAAWPQQGMDPIVNQVLARTGF